MYGKPRRLVQLFDEKAKTSAWNKVSDLKTVTEAKRLKKLAYIQFSLLCYLSPHSARGLSLDVILF